MIIAKEKDLAAILLTLERSAVSPFSELPPTLLSWTDFDWARQTKKQNQTKKQMQEACLVVFFFNFKKNPPAAH